MATISEMMLSSPPGVKATSVRQRRLTPAIFVTQILNFPYPASSTDPEIVLIAPFRTGSKLHMPTGEPVTSCMVPESPIQLHHAWTAFPLDSIGDGRFRRFFSPFLSHSSSVVPAGAFVRQMSESTAVRAIWAAKFIVSVPLTRTKVRKVELRRCGAPIAGSFAEPPFADLADVPPEPLRFS